MYLIMLSGVRVCNFTYYAILNLDFKFFIDIFCRICRFYGIFREFKVIHNDLATVLKTPMINQPHFITNISGNAVNINCWNRTCQRLMSNSSMDLHSLGKFKKYKNDWNYPIQVRHARQIIPEKKYTNFHSAIRVTILIGQCFGLNPVLGVREKDASKLRFKYLSWCCAVTFIYMFGQIVFVCSLIHSLFRKTMNTVDSATTLIFYMFSLITTVLFLRIAAKWPKLCMQISQMEAVDPTTDCRLRLKFNILSCSLLALACLEHLFAELHGVSTALDCEPDVPVYEGLMKRSFPWIFNAIPYSTFTAIITHVINLQCTFNWNFANLFVICMSIYLTARLEQVNLRVEAAKDKNAPSSFWRTIREDYNRVTQLVRQVDNIIGGVVFISFASNLLSICSQLLRALGNGIKATARCRDDGSPDPRYMHGYEHLIYCVYSFMFLVTRFLMVSLSASKIYLASLKPANALYDVSSVTYCVEIERFLGQIHGNIVALSGLQFFNVKRGLILTVAGTIVTYELVLMQFAGLRTPTAPLRLLLHYKFSKIIESNCNTKKCNSVS